MGAILSCLSFSLVGLFAIYKLLALINHAEYSVQKNTHNEYFEATYPFGHEDGFAVAVGVTDYFTQDKSTKVSLEDPSIGTVKFYLKSWGENAHSDDLFLELETRECQTSDFNDVEGSNKDSIFYPTNPRTESDLLQYALRMKCLKNPSDLVLWGNYDLPSAANLVLTFEKCDPHKSEVECKSDEEITEWLEFKYLVGIWNSKNFV